MNDYHRDIKILAKVRCAEYIRRTPSPKITPELSNLAYGQVQGHSERHRRLSQTGYIGWDNGSVLTEKGNAVLDKALAGEGKVYL